MVLAGQRPWPGRIGRIPKLRVRVRFSSPAPAMFLQVSAGLCAATGLRISQAVVDLLYQQPTGRMCTPGRHPRRCAARPGPANRSHSDRLDRAACHPSMPVGVGGAGTNVGGLTFATQAVSGALGVARNEANTCCAQRDASVTKWPIPAN
jgi:hypothetical protein